MQAKSARRASRRNDMANTKSPKPVTLKHMAAQMAADHEMTKVKSEAVLNDLIEMMTKHLKKGERIKLAGLGIFQLRNRAARMGRNPATGEPIASKASKKVAFRATKELKRGVGTDRFRGQEKKPGMGPASGGPKDRFAPGFFAIRATRPPPRPGRGRRRGCDTSSPEFG